MRLHERMVFMDRDDKMLSIEFKNRAFFLKTLYEGFKLRRQSVFQSVIGSSWVPPKVVLFV